MEQTTADQIVQELAQKYKPVVATPLKDGEVAPILNEENFNTLRGMLKSADEGNHKIAQLILNTCDIQKSIYWIWKLSRESGTWRMVNLRTKASREFRDLSNLFVISSKAARSFGEWLDDKGWMTQEIYQMLEENILATVKNQVVNRFYNVQITIKDQYKELAFTKTPIKINNNNEK